MLLPLCFGLCLNLILVIVFLAAAFPVQAILLTKTSLPGWAAWLIAFVISLCEILLSLLITYVRMDVYFLLLYLRICFVEICLFVYLFVRSIITHNTHKLRRLFVCNSSVIDCSSRRWRSKASKSKKAQIAALCAPWICG